MTSRHAPALACRWGRWCGFAWAQARESVALRCAQSNRSNLWLENNRDVDIEQHHRQEDAAPASQQVLSRETRCQSRERTPTPPPLSWASAACLPCAIWTASERTRGQLSSRSQDGAAQRWHGVEPGLSAVCANLRGSQRRRYVSVLLRGCAMILLDASRGSCSRVHPRRIAGNRLLMHLPQA
jgi:hypothetical protein